MEAESSAIEGRGDTASAGTRRWGKTDEVDVSEELEGMDIGEGSHPSKNQRTDEVEIIWEDLPQEELIQYGEPDKGKVDFMVNYDGTSS